MLVLFVQGGEFVVVVNSAAVVVESVGSSINENEYDVPGMLVWRTDPVMDLGALVVVSVTAVEFIQCGSVVVEFVHGLGAVVTVDKVVGNLSVIGVTVVDVFR